VLSVSRALDRIRVTFDEPTPVANAGLVLIATLAARLGVERLVNDTVRLRGRVGGALPGREVLTLVHAICAGASHIDDANVLRAGGTATVLGQRVEVPSTLGTFLPAPSPSATSVSSNPSPPQPQTPTDALTIENDTKPWSVTSRCRTGATSRWRQPHSGPLGHTRQPVGGSSFDATILQSITAYCLLSELRAPNIIGKQGRLFIGTVCSTAVYGHGSGIELRKT